MKIGQEFTRTYLIESFISANQVKHGVRVDPHTWDCAFREILGTSEEREFRGIMVSRQPVLRDDTLILKPGGPPVIVAIDRAYLEAIKKK